MNGLLQITIAAKMSLRTSPLFIIGWKKCTAPPISLSREQARPAFEQFMYNFTYRFVRRGQPERFADRRNFDDELQRGRIVVGSPGTVREQLGTYLEQSGANYVIGCFAFGSLPGEQVLTSVDLFAKEVMPALALARPPERTRV